LALLSIWNDLTTRVPRQSCHFERYFNWSCVAAAGG